MCVCVCMLSEKGREETEKRRRVCCEKERVESQGLTFIWTEIGQMSWTIQIQ